MMIINNFNYYITFSKMETASVTLDFSSVFEAFLLLDNSYNIEIDG